MRHPLIMRLVWLGAIFVAFSVNIHMDGRWWRGASGFACATIGCLYALFGDSLDRVSPLGNADDASTGNTL